MVAAYFTDMESKHSYMCMVLYVTPYLRYYDSIFFAVSTIGPHPKDRPQIVFLNRVFESLTEREPFQLIFTLQIRFCYLQILLQIQPVQIIASESLHMSI